MKSAIGDKMTRSDHPDVTT